MSNVFAPLNDFFDAIFVITLEGYEMRQQSIRENMNGLNFEFWFGTDKRKLDEAVLLDNTQYDDESHQKIKRTHRSMSLSEYACACSHRSIYKHMVDNNLKRVLIFEDDAIPNEDELKNFSTHIETLPDDWKVLLFDYYGAKYEDTKGRLKRQMYKLCHYLNISNWQNVSLSMINRMLMRPYNNHFYLAGRLSGAHAYSVTQDAAKYYLDYQHPIKLQADRLFYYCEGLDNEKIFACKKPMFLRGELSKVSSIQKQRRF